jgi:hypothetical protein
MLWVCFAAGGTGALHKMDGKEEGKLCRYVEATSQDISQEVSRPDLREPLYFSIWLGQGVIWEGILVCLFLCWPIRGS